MQQFDSFSFRGQDSSSNQTFADDDDYYGFSDISHNAKSILIFIALLACLIVVGCYVFMLWDVHDHNNLVYKKTAKLEDHSDFIIDRIAKGFEGYSFLKVHRPLDAIYRVLVCCGFKSRRVAKSAKLDRDDLEESFDNLWRTNIIGDINQEDAEDINDDAIMGRKVLIKYINAALPARPLLHKDGNSVFRFLKVVFTRHAYLGMFFQQSASTTRAMRWLGMWRGVLVLIFVDTVFIHVVFPDDSICPSRITESDCLSPSSLIDDRSLCEWNAIARTCRLIPPSESFPFVLAVMLFCLAIALPINALLTALMEDYAGRRPRLWQFGVNADSWLGTSYLTMFMGTTHHEAALQRWANCREMKIDQKTMRRATGFLYTGHSTAQEELHVLQERVREFFCASPSVAASDQGKHFTAAAVSRWLQILPTGDAAPLTVLQRLYYKSAGARLIAQIKRVRNQEKRLMETFVGCESHHRDLVLLHGFILEQISFFKRFALREYLSVHDCISPPEVDALPWLASWIVLISLFGFFLYWEFSWASVVGRATLELWAYVFAVAIMQDIFLCQVFKLLVMHVFAVEFCRGQLQNIYRTLIRVAMTSTSSSAAVTPVNDHFNVVQTLSAACRAARSNEAFRLPSSFILRHITDVDLMCCRQNNDEGRFFSVLSLLPAYLSSLQLSFTDRILELVLTGALTGILVSFHYIYTEGGSTRDIYVAVPFMFVFVCLLWLAYDQRKVVKRAFRGVRKEVNSEARFVVLQRKLNGNQLMVSLKGLWWRVKMLCSGKHGGNSKLKVRMSQWKHMNCSQVETFSTGSSSRKHKVATVQIPAEVRSLVASQVQSDEEEFLQSLISHQVFNAARTTNTNVDFGTSSSSGWEVYLAERDMKSSHLREIRRQSPILGEIAAIRHILRACLKREPTKVTSMVRRASSKQVVGESATPVGIGIPGRFLQWMRVAQENDTRIDLGTVAVGLKQLWKVYVPPGSPYPLQTSEIEELEEAFLAWKLSKRRLGVTHDHAQLSELMSWFLALIDLVTRERQRLQRRLVGMCASTDVPIDIVDIFETWTV